MAILGQDPATSTLFTFSPTLPPWGKCKGRRFSYSLGVSDSHESFFRVVTLNRSSGRDMACVIRGQRYPIVEKEKRSGALFEIGKCIERWISSRTPETHFHQIAMNGPFRFEEELHELCEPSDHRTHCEKASVLGKQGLACYCLQYGLWVTYVLGTKVYSISYTQCDFWFCLLSVFLNMQMSHSSDIQTESGSLLPPSGVQILQRAAGDWESCHAQSRSKLAKLC